MLTMTRSLSVTALVPVLYGALQRERLQSTEFVLLVYMCISNVEESLINKGNVLFLTIGKLFIAFW